MAFIYPKKAKLRGFANLIEVGEHFDHANNAPNADVHAIVLLLEGLRGLGIKGLLGGEGLAYALHALREAGKEALVGALQLQSRGGGTSTTRGGGGAVQETTMLPKQRPPTRAVVAEALVVPVPTLPWSQQSRRARRCRRRHRILIS